MIDSFFVAIPLNKSGLTGWNYSGCDMSWDKNSRKHASKVMVL